jgi:hypothetical protein
VSASNTEQEVIKVAQQIQRYLRDHPLAADSLEGVVSWWLGSVQRSRQPEVVREALQQLEAQGVVFHRILPDGNLIYAAMRSSLEEDIDGTLADH